MNAKEFLQQIKKIEIELSMLEHEISDLYTPISAVRFDNVPGVPDADATLHIVERIDTLKERYLKRIDELMAIRDEIVTTILRMQNTNAAKVIYHRYVDLWSYGRIARRLSYSVSHVKRLHFEGLQEIEMMIHNNTSA